MMEIEPRRGKPPIDRRPPNGARPSEDDGEPGREERSAGYRQLFIDHLGFIERTIRSIVRRNALSPADADDFEGWVKLRLIRDDFAILRKFEGRSRLTTYLTTVVRNLFRDFRIQRWGKWRPSAAAKREGELAVQLEALLYRDGFAFREAVAILHERFEVTASEEELERIAGSLPARTTRRFEDEAALARLPSGDRSDHRVVDAERRAAARHARRALRRALGALTAEDRLILRMRFGDGLTLAAVAAALHLDQRRLYPRVQRLYAALRREIEADGVRCEEVLAAVDDPEGELDALWGDGEAGPLR